MARTHPPPQTTIINAGTFITAMFMSGRLPSVPAIRGFASGRTSVRHRRDLRRGPRRFRVRVAGVLIKAHRGRFSGMARSKRLDRTVGCRKAA